MKLFLHRSDRYFFLLTVLVFAYIAVRAAVVDITHDEAYSFYNMKKFWYVEALCTGNTHWLNSAAIKLALWLNQESVFAVRWFSVLSALVFCSVTFLWIRAASQLHVKVFIFSVLLLNPYILDYLSIARGYSSGLMFQSLSIFCFIMAVQNRSKYFPFASLLFAGLSSLSNFSYVYFFLAFCVVYFTYYYFRYGVRFFLNRKFYRDGLYSLGVAAIVIRAFIFMTTCSNDVIGAGTPLLSEYFHVFTDGLIYRKFFVSPQTLTSLSVFVFFIISISCGYGIFARRKHNNHLYFFAACMLAIIITVTLVNYFSFNVVLPYYRSAVFLFPTTAICFICLVNSISNCSAKRIIMYVFSIILAINFVFSINFKSIFDFDSQANAKDCFDFLENEKAKHVGMCPEIYGCFRNYYQMTWSRFYNFFGEPINTNLPKGIGRNPNRLREFDHVILFPPYDLSYYKNNRVKFKAEKIFPLTGILILKVE